MKRSAGFTLIELLIAIVVMSILLAIALPMYSDYVRRGQVTEATNTLASTRVLMEQWYQDNRSYAGAGGACGVANPVVKYFTYTCALGTSAGAANQSYTLTATGGAGGMVNGFTYTINELNVQATVATGVWGHTSANTWVIKK
jgi:type IV pilus assembly protein PilE